MKRVLLLSIFFIVGVYYCLSSNNNMLIMETSGRSDSIKYELKVYPNPASEDRITLEIEYGKIYEIRLIDITGKEVIVKKLENRPTKYHLIIDSVPNGIYFVRVKTDDKKIVVKKLIVTSR